MTFMFYLLIVSVCYFGYVDVFSISVPFIVACLALIPALINRLNQPLRLNKLTIFYLSIIVVYISIDSVVNGDFSSRYLRANLHIFLFAFVYWGIDKELSLKLTRFFIALVFISLSAGTLQTLGSEWLWEARETLGFGEDPTIQHQIENRLKAPGLAYFSVQLSYQTTAAVLAAIYLLTNNVLSENKFFWILIFLCLTSAIIGMVSSTICILIVLVGFYLLKRVDHQTIKLQLLAIPAILFLFFVTDTGSRLIHPDSSILSRLVFGYIGLLILLENPFGVSTSNLIVEKQKALEKLGDTTLIGYSDYILHTSFHNTFINIAVDLGLLGLLIAVSGYFIFIFNKLDVAVNGRDFIKLPYTLFFVGYLVQISSHNASIFYGDLYIALILMLILQCRSRNNCAEWKSAI